jgi:hypothetical protein
MKNPFDRSGNHFFAQPIILRRVFLRLGSLLAISAALFAQTSPNKVLVVNGRTVSGAIRQIDGHSYIDVDSLAQITNGTVSIETSRIVLTIPSSGSGSGATAANAPAQSVPGFSRAFATDAISELAEMREWRGAVAAMITYGGAVSETLAQDYQQRVQDGLAQTSVAATTDSDRSALQLLQGESDKLASWASGIVAARQAVSNPATVEPNALANDPALAKIRDCSQFLDSMLVSGSFADDASCH